MPVADIPSFDIEIVNDQLHDRRKVNGRLGGGWPTPCVGNVEVVDPPVRLAPTLDSLDS